MTTYVVRTTLYRVNGNQETPLAGSESADFTDIHDAADEFMETVSEDEKEEIDEYLLCDVPELEADVIDVEAEELQE